ncbi:relaxase/mobilization nuclease domain-containing protein [Burkholderia multivorans]|uniref:relaxase/mobilization nuclease domain-containing protein n=1 Tax=Burkholderia multivorans TaxID=87883 RepID=UPI001C2166D9|nr:relaxase/mobilization nuclease domain-containing protein [Burkholderia multivorans]MBU9205467.1 relaxase/mobilization nuclease domain-containing protein [Burkholderia multivorans]MCO8353476.1 relaxase/mobilization nuclease domain-containing protein [Burkholderia multivorans]MCO8385735.1 relaxase/mobilization nuclease domain-containing protein [Burkholderia multivorans]MCO8406584.1 relaxase/mobilization nuclease domain-containing protein [Burkholderia multivorans]MCO8434831.1 relaxase/mobili
MPKPLTNVDGLLLQWGDRLFYEPVRARKAPRVSRGAWSGAPSALRAQIERTVRRVPEVMVKITNRPGARNGMGAIRAHLDYISRHGQVKLEDQDGNTISGRAEVQDLAQMWRVAGRGIAETSSKREAFNVMLSMPPGTDRAAVKDAARAFAREEFGDQRDYVFAAHDDEAHPHVHIVVLARGRDGCRLNPRKADLQRWRERFAHELRNRGVEANATPRRTRGVNQQYQTQASRHMGARNAKIYKRANILRNPQQVFNANLPTLSIWRIVASVLAESSGAGDLAMAKEIASFVRQMPVVTAVRGSNEVDGRQPANLPKIVSSETRPSEKVAPDVEP